MRLIDADELISNQDLHIVIGAGDNICIDIADIAKAPTIDVVLYKRGRWVKAHIAGYLKCNCCNDSFIYKEWLEGGKWKYCPKCGAKMMNG